MRHSLWSILLLSAVVLPGRAEASATFPETIQRYFVPPLPDPPHCTLCHLNNNGGKGSVVTPFGLAMLNQFGVKGMDNVAGLVAALDEMNADGWDGDGDGKPDIDEIKNGDDPNGAGGDTDGGAVNPIPPSYPLLKYGCDMGAPARPARGSRIIMAALACAMLLRRLDGARRRSAGVTTDRRTIRPAAVVRARA